MKVNILGQEYEIFNVKNARANPKLDDASGYVELWSKKIFLDNFKDDDQTVEKPELYKKKVLRHEIVHAFLHESGCAEFAMDEKLVDWIAIQAPKMFEAMKSVGAL